MLDQFLIIMRTSGKVAPDVANLYLHKLLENNKYLHLETRSKCKFQIYILLNLCCKINNIVGIFTITRIIVNIIEIC